MNEHVAIFINHDDAVPVEASLHLVSCAADHPRSTPMSAKPMEQDQSFTQSVGALLRMLRALHTILNEASFDDETAATFGDIEARLYKQISSTPTSDIGEVADKLAHVIDQVENKVDLTETPMVFAVLTSAHEDLLEIESSLIRAVEKPFRTVPPTETDEAEASVSAKFAQEAPARIVSLIQELWVTRARIAFLDEPNDLDSGLLDAPAKFVRDLIIKGQVLILKRAACNDDHRWADYVEPVLHDILNLFPLSPAEPRPMGSSKLEDLWGRCLGINIGDTDAVEELLTTPALASRDLAIKAQIMQELKTRVGRYTPAHVGQLARELVALPNLRLREPSAS